MTKMDLKQACEHLPELVEEAVAGHDVLITKDQKPLVRLVRAPEAPSKEIARRTPGGAKGFVRMSEDFDAPLDLKPAFTPDTSAKLKAWREVYAGFSDDEIAELESMILDRSRFLRGKR